MSNIEPMLDLRTDLKTLLLSWASGVIDAQEVHQTAETLYESVKHIDQLTDTDPRSIPIEIVSQLEILNHQLIVRDDIPAMLSFLDCKDEEAEVAWQKWNAYLKGVDYESRAKELGGVSPYAV